MEIKNPASMTKDELAGLVEKYGGYLSRDSATNAPAALLFASDSPIPELDCYAEYRGTLDGSLSIVLRDFNNASGQHWYIVLPADAWRLEDFPARELPEDYDLNRKI